MLAENLQYLIDKNQYSFEIESGRLNEICSGSDFSENELLQISEVCGIPVGRLLTDDIKSLDDISKLDIRFLVLDVDGVMTDGGMYYSESGDEHKKFNTKDGMSLKELKKKGFKVGIISSGYNKNIIQNRANLFDIKYVHVGTNPKLEVLTAWCSELGIELKNVAFIGDDINDKAVIVNVGLSACPADAVEEIREKCRVVLSKPGGGGCIREFTDRFLMPILESK